MVEVRPVDSARERRNFIFYPETIYRDHPVWVPPVYADIGRQIDPRRGDFFKHSAGRFFLAWRGSEIVGRIAALHNTRHLAAHDDGAGLFGFFECEDDPATAAALLRTAEDWLRQRGLKVARGPANFSIQDEAGVLLDGFEHAPMAGMAYTPPYYRALIEAAGYRKAKDLFVCRIDWPHWNVEQYDRIVAVASRVASGVTVRELNMADLPGEAGRLAEVFAEAWR